MPNQWIVHVKDFAQRNGLSYGCALSTPACKAEYRKAPKQQDYTPQIYKIGDLMRGKLKEEASQAFNTLIPKIKELSDGVEKDRQLALMRSLRTGIMKLQSPSS